jgi:hypothetical protein
MKRLRARRLAAACVVALACGRFAMGQAANVAVPGQPIAIVPTEGAEISGALNVAEGKALIGASGTVTAGEHPVTITLPRRGNVKLCATTKVSLTSDVSVPSTATADGLKTGAANEPAGLMMALDRGAIEAGFATGVNSDVILTPDFRILISGPGIATIAVRLGPKGDTCVDNGGPNAPYVTVSSVFEGGAYRVQPGQRVMFQQGSLRSVVDQETESCGCPPDAAASGATNAFPVAQSVGLTPETQVATATGSAASKTLAASTLPTAKVKFDSKAKPESTTAEPAVVAPQSTPVAVTPTGPVAPIEIPKAESKPGFFKRVGGFFRRLFGG